MNEIDSSARNPSILKQLFIVLIVLLIGAGLFWLLISTKDKAESTPIEERTWSVSVMDIVPGSHNPTLQIYGQVTTPINSQLTATVSAFVNSLEVSEGDQVEKHQVLIKLDPRDIELNYQQQLAAKNAAQAQIKAEEVRYQSDLSSIKTERALVNLSKRTVDRYQSLKGKNLSSELQLEEAERNYQQQLLSLNSRETEIADHPNRQAQLEANLQQAEVAFNRAQLDLERTQITAPYKGRISELLVAPGERVNQGTALVRIYATDQLELKAQIPTRYLQAVGKALDSGLPIIASGLYNQQPLEFKLDRLASEIRSGQGGVFGFFKLTTDDHGIELGRSFELSLQLPGITNSIVIPPQALFGTQRVYKVIDGRLKAVDVERLGEAINDGEYQILIKSSDLKPEDKIITTQLPTAINGLKVIIVGAEVEASANSSQPTDPKNVGSK